MEMPPDTLEAVGVNDLFVVVTVDASFTTEQAVVGRIDEIHILIAVRSRNKAQSSQICEGDKYPTTGAVLSGSHTTTLHRG
jgi:hypothetical protein